MQNSPFRTYLLVLPWESHHAGGVNLVVKNLASELSRSPDLRPLVAIDDWNAARPQLRSDELRFRFCWASRISVATAIKMLLLLPRRLAELQRLLRDRDVAVANFHYFGYGALGTALLKRVGLFKGALVLSFHGTDIRRPASAAERWVQQFILGRADALVACSQGIARRLADEMAAPAGRIRVVYNGVDHRTFHPDPDCANAAIAGLPAPYIVSVGSFIPRKNQACLLQAFARIAGRYEALQLHLAGADGPDLPALRAAAASLGIADRTHFHLSLAPAEVACLLAGASACVQPALAEGLPLAVLEAAAVGVPLVLSQIPGHDEIVTDGVDGRLFAATDATACAEAVAAMLDDPTGARRMAARQGERARREFTWENSLRGYRAALPTAAPAA